MRSKKLLRQLKKTLGTEEFESELLQFSNALMLDQKIPNLQLWVDRFSLFSQFLDAVDNAYLQSDKMLEMVNRSLEISTKELYEANEKFRFINKAMASMVNSLDEGFLVIDQGGRCGQIVSLAAKNFLGREPVGEHLADILNIPNSERETFNEWLNMVFNEYIDFEDLVDLAPKYLNNISDQKKIEIKFKPIRSSNDGKIVELVIILIDVSEKAATENKLNEQKLFTNMVIKYLNNKTNFIRLIQMSQDVAFSMISWEENEIEWKVKLNLLNRELHTLKGGLISLSIYIISNKVHSIEDQLANLNHTPFNLNEINKIRLLGLELQSCINEFLQKHRRIFNITNRSNVFKEISTDRIYLFSSELLKKGHMDLLKKFTDEIISVPFASLFAPIESHLYTHSIEQNKSIDFSIIDPQFIKVIPEFYDEFFKQMIHIFNNILEHGIEIIEERIASHKVTTGKISVELKLLDKAKDKSQQLQIIIADDGRGINPVVIRSRLAKKKIDTSHETDEHVIYHIFDYGFSTRDSITINSGRGIGMSAVLETIQNMNGTISVKSQYGKGTRFEIFVPYVCDLSEKLIEKLSPINPINKNTGT